MHARWRFAGGPRRRIDDLLLSIRHVPRLPVSMLPTYVGRLFSARLTRTENSNLLDNVTVAVFGLVERKCPLNRWFVVARHCTQVFLYGGDADTSRWINQVRRVVAAIGEDCKRQPQDALKCRRIGRGPAPRCSTVWSLTDVNHSRFRIEVIPDFPNPEVQRASRTRPTNDVSPRVVNHGVRDGAGSIRELPRRPNFIKVMIRRRPRDPAANEVAVLLWLVRVDCLDRIRAVRFSQQVVFVPDVIGRCGHCSLLSQGCRFGLSRIPAAAARAEMTGVVPVRFVNCQFDAVNDPFPQHPSGRRVSALIGLSRRSKSSVLYNKNGNDESRRDTEF